MPFVLRETAATKRYYCGETAGWIGDPPPPPPPPVDQAMRFETQEAAEKYAATYGMKAAAEQVAT